MIKKKERKVDVSPFRLFSFFFSENQSRFAQFSGFFPRFVTVEQFHPLLLSGLENTEKCDGGFSEEIYHGPKGCSFVVVGEIWPDLFV